jgi:hypothetical protein
VVIAAGGKLGIPSLWLIDRCDAKTLRRRVSLWVLVSSRARGRRLGQGFDPAAPAFFFLVFCLAAPSSYRVDRGRHLAASTFGRVLSGVCSLSNFRLARSRSLSLGAGGSRGIWRGEISNKTKQGDC